MDVKLTSINKIKPYEQNPRLIPETAVEAVSNSIKTFGWQQPIVVDKNDYIIAGHTRYLAAKKLGMTSVPVLKSNNLTEEQVVAYRILDNKTGEIAQWNEDVLNVELMKFDAQQWESLFVEADDANFNELDKYDFTVEEEDENQHVGLGNPIIQYNIIFDNKAQQESWHSFIKKIRQDYPSNDSIASKIIKFLKEATNGEI